MENILYNISQVLGITIIHSLWQGLVIYFMLRIAFLFAAQLSPSKRYLLALSSLATISCWFVYTLVHEISVYNWIAVKTEAFTLLPAVPDLQAGIRQFNGQSLRYYYSIEEYLPYISAIYFGGLLFNVIQILVSRHRIGTIKQTISIEISLQDKVDFFAGMLNIDRRVKVRLSKLVDVPFMVGYAKPLILLPFTLSSYLGTEEIEAILLHELAHIKRNDYLVNIVQQVISTLLFFNPCAQLINRIINEERENCCDDQVVQSAPNPVVYAKALFKLEQTRENNMRMAMSATGKKYQLLSRIERIMKTKKQTKGLRPTLAAMAILAIGTGSIALLNPEIAQGKISVKAITPTVINTLLADTGKKNAGQQKQTHLKKIYHISGQQKPNYVYNYSVDDKQVDELSAEIDRHSQAIDRYYNSPEYLRLQKEMEEKSNTISGFYDSPHLKQLNERLEELSNQFSQSSDNPEIKKLSEEMEKKGKEIDSYYNSPAYKALEKNLEAQSKLLEKEDYRSAGYQKRLEEVQRLSKEVSAYANNAPIKEQTEAINKMGQQINAYYNSPAYLAQRDYITQLGDSLRRAYANPEIKLQEKEMQKLGEQIRNYPRNPELKKEQELLNAAVKRMNAYLNSPEYKKKLKGVSNMHVEVPEAPEPPEQPEINMKALPEKPEVPEKPEAPEKPEQKEKPESNN